MKNKKIILLIVILGIAVVGTVTFFIFRPRHQELLPQQFVELPEKPKLIAEFQHGATRNSEVVYPDIFSLELALPIYSVAFSPVDTSLIASVNGAGTIKLWNINNTKEPVKILGHPGIFPNIGFSPTGELLASAGSGKLVLWDVDTGMKLNSLKTYQGQFAFSPDGKQLATLPWNEKGIHEVFVTIWDIRNPKNITEITTLYNSPGVIGYACAVDISSDGKWIAIGDVDGTINVWNLQTHHLVKTLKTSLHMMDFVKFSPNNKCMVAGGRDLEIYSIHSMKGYIMWELPSWQRKGEVLRGNVENLVFSPDGMMCVSMNDFYLFGRGIEIWSTANGAPITSLQTEAKYSSFSQDGKLLATGDEDGFVRVWELTQSQLDITKVRYDVVRLIYYLPKDKEPAQNITQKIDKTIREVQKFYADEMERHGFGRKTFTFETDENGKAKIYLMEEIQIERHDLQLNDIWLVFVDDMNDVMSVTIDKISKLNASVPIGHRYNHYDETFIFPTRRRIIVKDKIWMDDIKGYTGDGHYVSTTKKDLDWRLTAYSLKHLFSVLGREHRVKKHEPNVFKRIFNGISGIMPWNKDWVKLSKCEAEWLDKSRFFNPNQPFFDKRPEIEMNVLKPTTDSLLFQFTAADEDGIHQLQLFVPEDIEKQYWSNKLQGCQTLNGKKKATVVFEISNPEIKKGEIRMIDMHGNIASRLFKIKEKTSEPSE